MERPKIDLNQAALMKLSEQVGSDDGPGSPGWKREGSHTVRVNEAMIENLRANGGKVPGELAEFPFLIVNAIGAKTGEPRPVPLACQEIDGRIVVVASMGGSQRNPPWYHNLVANPEVAVELNGETFQANAIVTQGADRDELFRNFCKGLPHFADYEERVERVIPVVELKRC